MAEPIIVTTDLAVVWLSREGVDAMQARRFIYTNSHRGHLTNWGGHTRGSGKWDLREIRDLMWPKTQGEHPIDRGGMPDVD